MSFRARKSTEDPAIQTFDGGIDGGLIKSGAFRKGEVPQSHHHTLVIIPVSLALNPGPFLPTGTVSSNQSGAPIEGDRHHEVCMLPMGSGASFTPSN